MKAALVIFLTVALCACTTLHPVLAPASDVRQQISSGALLKAGDSVSITTTDGTTHSFSVTAVRDGFVEGRGVSIPIEQIAAVGTRELSVGKTLLVVAGVAVALVASKGYSETHRRSCSGGTIC